VRGGRGGGAVGDGARSGFERGLAGSGRAAAGYRGGAASSDGARVRFRRVPAASSWAAARPWSTVAASALALMGCVFLCPAAVAGQGGAVLTLEDALVRAGETNPAYRRALNDLDLNAPERRQAWGAYLPEFSISTGTGLNLNRQLIATDFFGNPIENPMTEWRKTSSTSQSIRASISLFEWGQRSHGMAAQRARARAREATVLSRYRTLRAGVVRAYRSAQSQQALLAVEEELLGSRLLDLETTRRRFELAGASRVDVLTAELNVQQQEQRIQQARGRLQQTLLSLRTAIGDPAMDEFQVTETLPEPFDPSGIDPEELVAGALASNPSLMEQEASLSVSRAQARSARASRWPGLGLSFSANQSTFGDEWSGAFDPFPNRSRSGGASFGITIPLFPRFDTGARVAQAEVSLANAEQTVIEARLQVEERVRAQLIAVQTAYQSYLISLRSQEIAQERLRLAREQFGLGSRSFTELQQDIDAAAQAQREVVSQLFALVEAQVNLEETVGEGMGAIPAGREG
jgi:outer membrane protein